MLSHICCVNSLLLKGIQVELGYAHSLQTEIGTTLRNMPAEMRADESARVTLTLHSLPCAKQTRPFRPGYAVMVPHSSVHIHTFTCCLTSSELPIALSQQSEEIIACSTVRGPKDIPEYNVVQSV